MSSNILAMTYFILDPATSAALSILSLLYLIYRKFTRISLSDIPGPKNPSFFVGHMAEFFQTESGYVDLKWQKEFGGIVRMKGPFGEDRLMISDAKALQYVYQTGGYDFPKSPERRALSRSLADLGPGWAEGDAHKRQRRILAQAFGAPEVRALLGPVRRCVQHLSAKWTDIISSSPNEEAILNIPQWLGLTTLEAMGEAAFDYRFGALDGEDNPLIEAYNNFPALLFASPSKWDVFVQAMTGYFPMLVLEWYYDYFPGRRFRIARDNSKIATQVSKDLIAAKSAAHLDGMEERDVLSLIVKANLSSKENARLSENEVLGQMRGLMLAGSETTSKTLTWIFLDIAKHPKVQDRLREEIRAQQKLITLRGDTEFSLKDYDEMSYLKAVVKEGLRLHPPLPTAFRMTGKDDVIPLSKPLTTISGKVIHEVAVPAGTRIFTSIPAYNRDPDIWGQDAHLFNPDRWIDNVEKRSSVGVYANLLSFSGGVRFCPGWRFALIQLNTFIVELLGTVVLAPTEDVSRIRRENCLVVVPMLEGETEKGAQLPMKVTFAPRDDEDQMYRY